MTLGPTAFDGAAPVPSARAASTLIQGRTFCLSEPSGDVLPDRPLGLFFLDSRILSRFEMHVNGFPLEGLAVESATPFEATFVTRAHPAPGHADSDLVVLRQRAIGRGLREVVTITNYGLETTTPLLQIHLDADFAHIFDVKNGHPERHGLHGAHHDELGARFERRHGDRTDQVEVRYDTPADDPGSEHGPIVWHPTLEPGGTWQLCLEVTLTRNGRRYEPRFPCGCDDREALPHEQHARWHTDLPVIESDDRSLSQAVSVASADIGSLRIFDPDHPDWAVIAAGAPWFMTVFGRDSLLTAWMTLVADPDLARGVLRTLARLQGTGTDPATEEQPGRILHELRATGSDTLGIEGADVYYGSVDATPLFVMLLGELARWHPEDSLVEDLLPAADRALAWMEEYGDPTGSGFVSYERHTPSGLRNQGWKDSWDGVRHADGTLAETPIALCEIQGYVYAAHQARAELAESRGDHATAEHHRSRATRLRERFDTEFWDEELGTYVLALDGHGRPVRVRSSNAAHCLWSGIARPERAERVAGQLLAPDGFSGWGVRTLDARERAFNPVSYHNGSVWPHDTAIAIEGLSRYGFTDAVDTLVRAQLDLAGKHDGRLPELITGFSRDQLGVPAAYPASCSPQAWAAAAPFLWLRSLLRLDVDRAGRQLWIDPQLPSGMRYLRIDGLRVAAQRLTITVEHGRVRVDDTDGIEVRLGRRGIDG